MHTSGAFFMEYLKMVKTFLEEIHTIAQPLHDNGMSVQKSVGIAIEIIRAKETQNSKR